MSDSSFYDSYDPFEYMTDQAERGEDLLSAAAEAAGAGHHDPFEDNDVEIRKRRGSNGPEDVMNTSAHSQLSVYTPNRQNVRKHARQPSVTEVANAETILRRKKQKEDYDEKVRKTEESSGGCLEITSSLKKERDLAVDSEVIAFTKMVTDVRTRCKHDDPLTNPGLVFSACIESTYPRSTSIKLKVHSPNRKKTINFTCDGEIGKRKLKSQLSN